MSKSKKAIGKRIAAYLAALGLCGASVAFPVNTQEVVWAEESVTQTNTGQAVDVQTGTGQAVDVQTNTGQAVDVQEDGSGQDGEEQGGTEQEEPKLEMSQKISVKVSGKTYTADQFKASKKTFQIGASAKTALSYKVTKGSEYVSVNKKGLVTIKRWTPKGTYQVTVTAKATDAYKKATRTVTIKVKAPAAAAMSKVNMSWNLKYNKKVTYTTSYLTYNPDKKKFGTLTKSGSVRLKEYNLEQTSNGKKNKLTYTVEFVTPTDFSKTEIDQIIAYGGQKDLWGSLKYVAVVDYQTGENLYKSNPYGVKVTFGKWQKKVSQGINKYYDSWSDGWFSEDKVNEITVTVTYPKEYQDLCILAGGITKRDALKNKPYIFNKNNFVTPNTVGAYSKKDKLVCHGLRVK